MWTAASPSRPTAPAWRTLAAMIPKRGNGACSPRNSMAPTKRCFRYCQSSPSLVRWHGLLMARRLPFRTGKPTNFQSWTCSIWAPENWKRTYLPISKLGPCSGPPMAMVCSSSIGQRALTSCAARSASSPSPMGRFVPSLSTRIATPR